MLLVCELLGTKWSRWQWRKGDGRRRSSGVWDGRNQVRLKVGDEFQGLSEGELGFLVWTVQEREEVCPLSVEGTGPARGTL